jgi:hypothetical protein
MPWDTEAYDTYTIIQDSLGFAGIYRLIGINSIIEELLRENLVPGVECCSHRLGLLFV